MNVFACGRGISLEKKIDEKKTRNIYPFGTQSQSQGEIFFSFRLFPFFIAVDVSHFIEMAEEQFSLETWMAAFFSFVILVDSAMVNDTPKKNKINRTQWGFALNFSRLEVNKKKNKTLHVGRISRIFFASFSPIVDFT